MPHCRKLKDSSIDFANTVIATRSHSEIVKYRGFVLPLGVS